MHCDNPGTDLFDEVDYSLGDRCPLMLSPGGTLEISPRSIRVPPASPDTKGRYDIAITGYVDAANQKETFADGYLVALEITDYSPAEYDNLCDDTRDDCANESDALASGNKGTSCGNSGALRFVLPEASPTCTLTSPSRARCILDASGNASLAIETDQPGGSADRCVLVARSGRKAALAVIRVEQSLGDTSLDLEFTPTTASGCQADQSCIASIRPPLDGACEAAHSTCDEIEQTAYLVASTRRDGAPLATGTSERINLSSVPLTSGTLPLGFTLDGDPLPTGGVDVSTGIATVSMATDGRGGAHRITAELGGLTTSRTVQFPSVPAGVSVERGTSSYLVKVADCDDHGIEGVLVSVSNDGLTYSTPVATGAGGTASVPMQPPDGPHEVRVQLSELGADCSSVVD